MLSISSGVLMRLFTFFVFLVTVESKDPARVVKVNTNPKSSIYNVFSAPGIYDYFEYFHYDHHKYIL